MAGAGGLKAEVVRFRRQLMLGPSRSYQGCPNGRNLAWLRRLERNIGRIVESGEPVLIISKALKPSFIEARKGIEVP